MLVSTFAKQHDWLVLCEPKVSRLPTLLQRLFKRRVHKDPPFGATSRQVPVSKRTGQHALAAELCTSLALVCCLSGHWGHTGLLCCTLQ